jgi:hypothetical protein
MMQAICLLAWLVGAAPQGGRAPVFEELGRVLLDVAAQAPGAPAERAAAGEAGLLQRLAQVHDVFDVGALEVWLPVRGLGARGGPEALQRPRIWIQIPKLAVELQARWYERLAPDDRAANERGRAALEELERWARRLQVKAEPPRDADFASAARELRAQWPDDGMRPRVFVAPTRAQFVGLLGAAGIVLPNQRGALWTELSLRSANTYFLPTSLAFACVGGPLSEEDSPIRERELEAEALRSYAAHALSHQFAHFLVPTAPLWFGEGLALYDTVAVVGVDETLCSGYSGRKVTPVDDVQSALGNALIYARIERSPYRTGGCKDLFVDELRLALVEGGFRVLDLDTSREGVTLGGPFLRERAALPAQIEQGPRGLKEGYAEFFRAYCAAFVAYLAQERAGDASLLEAVLRRLHERRKQLSGELATVLEELTGKTLGESLDPQHDLEGAFVQWLATRR